MVTASVICFNSSTCVGEPYYLTCLTLLTCSAAANMAIALTCLSLTSHQYYYYFSADPLQPPSASLSYSLALTTALCDFPVPHVPERMWAGQKCILPQIKVAPARHSPSLCLLVVLLLMSSSCVPCLARPSKLTRPPLDESRLHTMQHQSSKWHSVYENMYRYR